MKLRIILSLGRPLLYFSLSCCHFALACNFNRNAEEAAAEDSAS